MSNYNVTRFFRSARHSLKGGSIIFFMKTHIIIIFTKIFTTKKILKMENKHPEHFKFSKNFKCDNQKTVNSKRLNHSIKPIQGKNYP
jgi:hypothetical protein